MAGSQIGGAAAAAMNATPYGAAANMASSALGGIMGGAESPATSAATSGDASQNAAFKAAFGDTFGAFNFAPANGEKANTASGSVSLPVVVGIVGLAVTLVLFATRSK